MMVQQLMLKLAHRFDTADGLFRAYSSFNEGHHAIYVRDEEAAALSAWHSRHSTAGIAQQAWHSRQSTAGIAGHGKVCHDMPCHASVKCFARMAARARMIRKVQHYSAVVQACTHAAPGCFTAWWVCAATSANWVLPTIRSMRSALHYNGLVAAESPTFCIIEQC